MAVKSKTFGSTLFNIINYAFFALVMIVCILPVWHVFCASFSDASWVLNQSGLIWRINKFSLNGYRLVFNNSNIWIGYMNTLLYVFGNTVIGMFLTVMAGYALSRKDFLWASPIMFIISFTMLFSGGIVPSYILVTQTLHMFDSRWALIIPTCMNAFYLILVRTALQNVPAVDVAHVDISAQNSLERNGYDPLPSGYAHVDIQSEKFPFDTLLVAVYYDFAYLVLARVDARAFLNALLQIASGAIGIRLLSRASASGRYA